jgi:hypothetical protein
VKGLDHDDILGAFHEVAAMTMAQVEKKLAALERKVERLQRQSNANGGKWWIDDAGRFSNDPVFEEIVRLGRQYRESLRPKPRRGKGRRAAS